MREENIIMTLLKSLSASYEYLIIVFKLILMKQLTMEYVTTHLILGMSKCKEKKPKTKMAMVLRQNKVGNLLSW